MYQDMYRTQMELVWSDEDNIINNECKTCHKIGVIHDLERCEKNDN